MLLQRFATEGSLFAYAPPSLCAIDGDGGDTGGGAAAGITVTDEYSAGKALEGILDFGDEPSTASATQSDAEASDAGTDENPSTGEEEGQSETPTEATPPASIEPPKSWSAEERALFSKLPPEAQTIVARREGERDKLLLQRGEEIANERKASEAERAAIATQRTQYQQNLQQLLHVALPEAKVYEGIDWQKLAIDSPAEYVRLSAQRDALRQRVGTVSAELQRVQEQQQTEQQQRQQQALAAERTKLVEKIPEFGDAEKGPKLVSDMRSWLQAQGFNASEIGMVADHRLIGLALKAMRADQADTARKAAEAKRANPAPAVQRPGSAQGSDETRGRALQGKMQQLGRSGSTRDAAAILIDLL